MADYVDEANRVADQHLAKSIAKARGSKGGQAKVPRQSEPYCVDCGEAIPDARRIALPGVRRCFHCQQRREG